MSNFRPPKTFTHCYTPKQCNFSEKTTTAKVFPFYPLASPKSTDLVAFLVFEML